ncbi:hypothetical protein D3C72_1097800 [compost metagenome]
MKDGALTYKYYDQDFELLAFQNSLEDDIIPTKKMLENGNLQYLEELSSLDTKGIYGFNELNQEIEEGILPLDDDEEKIQGTGVINREDDEKLNEEETVDNKEVKKRATISASESKNIKAIESTKLNQIIKGKTLENMLGLEKNGIEDGIELVVIDRSEVPSDKLNNNTSNDIIGVKNKNGEIIVLGEDILKKDTKGIDIDERNVTIENNGQVNKESVLSRYQIMNGGQNQYISIGRDEVSNRAIKYSQWSAEKGEYLDYELETSKTLYRNSDVNNFTKGANQGNKIATETLEKEEIHENTGCEEKDITMIDQDKNNDSHLHIQIQLDDRIPNTDRSWRDLANECGFRGQDALEKTIKLFEDKHQGNPDRSNQEIVEEIVNEIEEQMPTREHK